MGKNDFLYNTVSIVFVLLSLMVCLVALAWTTGTINVPNSLSPSTDVFIPTAAPRITFTPSMTLPASRTPFPTETPFPTFTPETLEAVPTDTPPAAVTAEAEG